VLVAITTAAKLAVAPLGDFPYLMYFACVLAASLVGGWIPGVFTTALAALAANALFETPAGAFFESSRALLRGLGFVAECTAIVVLCDVVLVGREREREEAQRERRERVAIERERRRFTAIFEHALDAITLLDDEQRIVEANPAAAALFGRSREELVGRPAR
jgi:PAS domain-containing protein